MRAVLHLFAFSGIAALTFAAAALITNAPIY